MSDQQARAELGAELRRVSRYYNLSPTLADLVQSAVDALVYCPQCADKEQMRQDLVVWAEKSERERLRADGAEAECARLREALSDLAAAEHLDDDHPRLVTARSKARAALASPGTGQ